MKLRCSILVSLLIVLTLMPACYLRKGFDDYKYYYDVSQPPRLGYIQFEMTVSEKLEGVLYVWEGSVVFVVTDNWDRHIVDTIVKAGHQKYICIKAKQTGQIYRCWFGYESDKEEELRRACFYCDKRATGWK